MDDSRRPDDRLGALLADGDEEAAAARLEWVRAADPEERKGMLRTLRPVAEERPSALVPVLSELSGFLADDERSVRLTAAKLFVTVAETDPDAASPAVPALVDRLADEGELYYVRARAAEALGYVAVERPGEVASPEVLADLRVGLAFDEPEVREKLAKALEHVALGDPGRLRHQVSTLAEHLGDDRDLVRYHLCTALVAVGCEWPGALAEARDALVARLADENAYVRGRAAEAVGLLARSDADGSLQAADLGALAADDGDGGDEASFVADRVRFARTGLGDGDDGDATPAVGTVDGVRRTTDGIGAEIGSPDATAECPHCGLELSDSGPPLCPGCGAPR